MNFTSQYLEDVAEIANSIDKNKVENMIEVLLETKSKRGRLFVLGVGGSASNSSHAVNDFRKLANMEAYAPCDNVAELTARTNDEGWESVFEGYLRVSNLTKNDTLLILSVGGGDSLRKISLNLCKAIDYSKAQGSKVLAIVGRNDGYAAKFADLCLVIPQANPKFITPHSESFQAVIWHLFVSHPKLNAHSTLW
jgi:D-sedoheptulose 7-phosphate isomerase